MRRLRERVHRRDDPRAGEEGAEDRERERGDDEREVPDPQHPAPFLHHHRVDERGRGDPRQQRRVLHRVPAPVPAPAEHLVAPPRAEHDPDREEAPRDERHPAGVGQPPLTEATGDERRDRERERHGEADVPEVEHRRVERHQRVVLQQRVGPLAVGWDRAGDEGERVRGHGHEHEEEERDDEADDQRPPHHRILDAPAEPVRDERQVAGEEQDPQQDRALERGPQAGDREEEGCGARVVVGHVLDREVVGDERPLHRPDRDQRAEHHDVHADATLAQRRRVAGEHTPEQQDDADRGAADADGDAEHTQRRPHDLSAPSLGCRTSLARRDAPARLASAAAPARRALGSGRRITRTSPSEPCRRSPSAAGTARRA